MREAMNIKAHLKFPCHNKQNTPSMQHNQQLSLKQNTPISMQHSQQ
jgi:hypothetical protein